MSIILENEIFPLLQLYNKTLKEMTFKDIISLIFHAFQKLSMTNDEWNKYYKEFQLELFLQNEKKCPHLITTTNDFNKRVEMYCDKGFIPSNNFLIMLLRLLYIENRKKNIIGTSGYHKILDHNITPAIHVDSIKKISIEQLFDLLKPYLSYYMKIYNDELMFEYQMANAIMAQLT